jgi:hypothetical protein
MEIDIKCLECGKGTRNFELGRAYYLIDNPSETFIVENNIICPKCKKDISNEKCLVKTNELMMKLVVANLCLSDGKVPKHLSKTMFLNNKEDYEIFKGKGKAKPKLVEKF